VGDGDIPRKGANQAVNRGRNLWAIPRHSLPSYSDARVDGVGPHRSIKEPPIKSQQSPGAAKGRNDLAMFPDGLKAVPFQQRVHQSFL
jgi:hypothetical protein